MKIYRLLFSLVLVLSITINIRAQSSKTQNADNAFKRGEYYTALGLYESAYAKEKDKATKAEIVFKIAECYRLMHDIKKAIMWYEKAIKVKYPEPEAILHLADMLKASGRYADAVVQYNKYKQADPSDPRGDLGVKSSELAQQWKDKPSRYKLENLAPLNSKFSDFSVAYVKKGSRTLIFTSNREEATGKDLDGWSGQKFSDLFETTSDKKGKWSVPKPLAAPVNTDGNEGTATFDKRGNVMYFTRCAVEKGKASVCKIYSTRRKGTDWDEPQLISFASDSFTIGHPSLSADDMQLYFASSMEGGYGKKDIWVSTYDKKKKLWGNPINLGPKINTAEDDMFPFIHDDGTLYFASKGHLGMGGLDIFSTKKQGNNWETPTNMKYPINSAADDFGIVLDETNQNGYMTSNRDGGKGSDDIYAISLPPLIFTLQGKVIDIDTKANLEGATIELAGSDGTSLKYVTDKTGSYSFDKTQIKPNTAYKLTVSLKNYLGAKGEESTVGLEQSKDIFHDFALKTTVRSIVLPNILYDLAKWDLRPESKVSLDGLVETLNDNPQIVIEIGSHTDTRDTDGRNDTLSQRRAESVVDYLIKNGIAADRLKAKGYGERVSRKLQNDEKVVYEGRTFVFKKGDVITDQYINGLSSKMEQEAAHQLNRRTEFKVLRDNYVPVGGLPEGSEGASQDQGQISEATATSDPAMESKEEATVEETVSEDEKYYTSVKGDTYDKIAKKYNLTLEDLKKLNNITKGSKPAVGTKLKVVDDNTYHVVVKGDTYSKVAKKYGITLTELKKLNGITSQPIKIGTKLRVNK